MGIHHDPFDPIRPIGERRARAADIGQESRVARDGIEVIAHGAMVCPECAAPVVTGGSVPVATRLQCGFCDHSGRARTFLVRDVFDTLANEVYLIARVRI